MAVASLLAKSLGRGAAGEALHPLQVSAGRFLFAFLAVAAASAILRPSLKALPVRRMALRTLCGWLGASGLFAAAALMPLAEATAITFLNPVLAMVLAIPLLGERVGPWRWTGAAIALAGALILIRPGTEAFQPAALLALGAAFAMALEGIIVKRLARDETAMRILLLNNAMGAVLALSAAALVWVAPTGLQWAMLAGVGLAVLSAQICFIGALKRADASFAMPFFYTTLVFAAALDLAVFADLPDALAALGAGVVVAGALLIAWRDRARAVAPRAAPQACSSRSSSSRQRL